MAKIIIAEDSYAINNITRRILEMKHHQVKSVNNGKEAIDVLARDTFDLLLLDLFMPVMDGLTCVKHIRAAKDKPYAALPIVVITGNNKNYKDADFAEYGVQAVLQKPLDYDELVVTVDRYAAGR